MSETARTVYFKLPDGTEFFKITPVGEFDVSIMSVNSDGIIVYDTRISRPFVEKTLEGVEMIDSTKEEFETEYYKIRDRNLKEEVEE